MTKRKYVVFSNDVAPVHPGVYQREMSYAGKQKWFWAKFQGGSWHVSNRYFTIARYEDSTSARQVGDNSAYSTLRWRGLAEKPE